MLIEEAITKAAAMENKMLSVLEVLEWFQKLTPSHVSKMAAETFFWCGVEAGDLVYMPMGYLYTDKVRVFLSYLGVLRLHKCVGCGIFA